MDCYDFPVAFRTPNLIEIFKEYEGSFSWIWIHDSRILFIFDTEENAKSAYLAKRNGTNYKVLIIYIENFINIYYYHSYLKY